MKIMRWKAPLSSVLISSVLSPFYRHKHPAWMQITCSGSASKRTGFVFRLRETGSCAGITMTGTHLSSRNHTPNEEMDHIPRSNLHRVAKTMNGKVLTSHELNLLRFPHVPQMENDRCTDCKVQKKRHHRPHSCLHIES